MGHYYCKRPVVVQAFQMTRERRADSSTWPLWLVEARGKRFSEPGAVSYADYPAPGKAEEEASKLVIRERDRIATVYWGDYIVRGVNGELYPLRPDIFEATYDKVED